MNWRRAEPHDRNTINRKDATRKSRETREYTTPATHAHKNEIHYTPAKLKTIIYNVSSDRNLPAEKTEEIPSRSDNKEESKITSFIRESTAKEPNVYKKGDKVKNSRRNRKLPAKRGEEIPHTPKEEEEEEKASHFNREITASVGNKPIKIMRKSKENATPTCSTLSTSNGDVIPERRSEIDKIVHSKFPNNIEQYETRQRRRGIRNTKEGERIDSLECTQVRESLVSKGTPMKHIETLRTTETRKVLYTEHLLKNWKKKKKREGE